MSTGASGSVPHHHPRRHADEKTDRPGSLVATLLAKRAGHRGLKRLFATPGFGATPLRLQDYRVTWSQLAKPRPGGISDPQPRLAETRAAGGQPAGTDAGRSSRAYVLWNSSRCTASDTTAQLDEPLPQNELNFKSLSHISMVRHYRHDDLWARSHNWRPRRRSSSSRRHEPSPPGTHRQAPPRLIVFHFHSPSTAPLDLITLQLHLRHSGTGHYDETSFHPS